MKYIPYLIFGLLSGYVAQAFVRWDMYWISEIWSWQPDERFGLLILMGICAGWPIVIKWGKL